MPEREGVRNLEFISSIMASAAPAINCWRPGKAFSLHWLPSPCTILHTIRLVSLAWVTSGPLRPVDSRHRLSLAV